MNYRHLFHAGNVADVFKHLVLARVLEALRLKETPFCVIDTHAGSGLYRLQAPGEFEQGIGRLWPARTQWPQLAAYFELLAALNNGNGSTPIRDRPGLSAHCCVRRIAPCSWSVIRRRPRRCVTIYSTAAASPSMKPTPGRRSRGLLPPKENRGLVFIDPPYEQPDEFGQVARALRAAHPRWRNGLYLVWYPIKARRPVEKLHEAVRALGAEALAVELLMLPEDVPQRLNGSGVILINPPWKLEETLRTLLPPLATFLAGPDGQPQTRFVNLSPGKIRRFLDAGQCAAERGHLA